MLGHPRTKAFLSHCGVNGLYEVKKSMTLVADTLLDTLTLNTYFNARHLAGESCLNMHRILSANLQMFCRRRTTAFPLWRCPSLPTSRQTPTRQSRGCADFTDMFCMFDIKCCAAPHSDHLLCCTFPALAMQGRVSLGSSAVKHMTQSSDLIFLLFMSPDNQACN